MDFNREINVLLDDILGEDVYSILKENKCIIAGGALTSLFTNKEINDVDVYFRSKKLLGLTLLEMFRGDFKMRCVNVADKSITFINESGYKVQFIVYKFFKNVIEIFKDFDFTINMIAFDLKDDVLHHHDNAIKHLAQRYLEFNPGTAYPLMSALRVSKYTERGYKISKSQFLCIMMRINCLEINSWGELKSHLGGMYGLNMDDVFPEDQEFSMIKAIEILGDISPSLFDSKISMAHNISINKNEIFKRMFPEAFGNEESKQDPSGRFFKNVRKDYNSHDLYSFWDKNFKYEGIVNGGKKGVFCYEGDDVLTDVYGYSTESVILELHPIIGTDVTDTSYDPNKLSLKGDVAVGKHYTKVEFIETFKTDKSLVSFDWDEYITNLEDTSDDCSNTEGERVKDYLSERFLYKEGL